MALIKCKECGKEISSTAGSCPHCGYRTEQGRIVSEAKAYLLWSIINFILLFVGFSMFMGNYREFIDRLEYLEDYRYFSDEGQRAVRHFIIGTVILVGCFVDSWILWNKTHQMKNISSNKKVLSQDEEWYCKECCNYTAGRQKCEYCNSVRPFGTLVKKRSSSVAESNAEIPAWKRIQMEQETKTKE